MNNQGEDYEFSDSFLYPLIWNFYIWALQQAKTMACVVLGSYGVFWRNDRGDYMNACFEIGLGGINPTDIFIERTVTVAP